MAGEQERESRIPGQLVRTTVVDVSSYFIFYIFISYVLCVIIIDKMLNDIHIQNLSRSPPSCTQGPPAIPKRLDVFLYGSWHRIFPKNAVSNVIINVDLLLRLLNQIGRKSRRIATQHPMRDVPNYFTSPHSPHLIYNGHMVFSVAITFYHEI